MPIRTLTAGCFVAAVVASAGLAGVVKPKCSVRYDAGDPRGGPTAASPDPSKWPSNITNDFGDLFYDRLNIFVEVPELGTTLDARANEAARLFAAQMHRRRTLYGSKPDHFSLWPQNIAGQCDTATPAYAATRFTSLVVNDDGERLPEPTAGWPTGGPGAAEYTQPWLPYARKYYEQGGQGLSAWSYLFGQHLAEWLGTTGYKLEGEARAPFPARFEFDQEGPYLTNIWGELPMTRSLLAVKQQPVSSTDSTPRWESNDYRFNCLESPAGSMPAMTLKAAYDLCVAGYGTTPMYPSS